MRVYEYVSSAGSIIDNMAEQFAGEADAVLGELNMQVASHVSCQSFDDSLAQFHRLYPNVLISLNAQPSADIVNAVAQGQLHIGISNKKTAQTGLHFDLLGYEQMAFYCGPRHPLFGRTDLTAADLRGLAYVSFESDQPGEGLSAVSSVRAEQQFWGRLVAVSSNEEEVRRLILAGLGFGALTVEGPSRLCNRRCCSSCRPMKICRSTRSIWSPRKTYRSAMSSDCLSICSGPRQWPPCGKVLQSIVHSTHGQARRIGL